MGIWRYAPHILEYNPYNRAYLPWYMIAIERTVPGPENDYDPRSRKMRMKVVPNRSAEVLMELIVKWIKPGTHIMSDCWAAYNSISSINDYTHTTVNHSNEFKAADGTCTNTIEGGWHQIKKFLPTFGTRHELLNSYFHEFCWYVPHNLD